LIDNSVIVLENIYRHMETGESPEVAAEKGANEVALPVLAITLATVVVFFPVTFLYGVSQFLSLPFRFLFRSHFRGAALLHPHFETNPPQPPSRIVG
jgi:multidrug efflux pump subunit AcrB